MVDKAVLKMLDGFPPVHPRALPQPVAMIRPLAYEKLNVRP